MKKHPASRTLIEQQPGSRMWIRELWRLTERMTLPNGFDSKRIDIEDNFPSRREARQRLKYLRSLKAG